MRGLASLCAACLALAAALPCSAQDDAETKALLADLVADLGSDSEYVRSLARDRLAAMESDAVIVRMVELLGDPAAPRPEAARVLSRLGPRAGKAIPALRRAVEEGPDDLRAVALDALCAVSPEEPLPVPALVAMLESGDDGRLGLALRAIARMGAAAAATELPLARLLRERVAGGGDPAACGPIASALGATGGASKETVSALADYAVAVATSESRTAGFNALRHAAPLVLGELIRRGVDLDQTWIVQLAALAGAKPGDPLVELAGSGSPEQRLAALRLLGTIGAAARGAIEVLIVSLGDPSAAIRRAAADALGAIGRDARPAIPALLDVLRDRESRARFWAARALGAICAGGDAPGVSTRAERRVAKAGGGSGLTENAVELGLRWLAAHQDEDGRWDADDFMKHDPADDKCDGAGGAMYDVGVTGLAILAFLGAGYTDRGSGKEGRYAENVRAGLRFLVQSQSDNGVFGTRATGHFIYNHAIATLALAEAYAATRDPGCGEALRRGVRFIEAARNPHLAWRYEPHGGENDTSVTGWCLHALKSTEAAGLPVDPDALAGAGRWIARITDRTTGRVGYSAPGGLPARPEGKQDKFPAERSHSMTGVGILCRIFLGEAPGTSEVIKRGANLCAGLPPRWNPDDGSIDMYYWYYGTLALYQVGGTPWKTWNAAMVEAVVKHQHLQGSGSRTGSWDPIGVWGYDGGRVYSTAMLVMCLEVYYRYDRIAVRAAAADPVLEGVRAALAAAATDDDPTLAKAAGEALARIGSVNAGPPPPAVDPETKSYSSWRAEYIECADRADWNAVWKLVRDVAGKPFPFPGVVTNRSKDRVTVRLRKGYETLTIADPALLGKLKEGTKVVLHGYVETSAKTTQELIQRGTSLRMEFGYLSE